MSIFVDDLDAVHDQCVNAGLEITYTIGFSERSEEEAEAQLQRIVPQERRRHERIDEVAEPEMTRRFYVQVAEDDFTNKTTDD